MNQKNGGHYSSTKLIINAIDDNLDTYWETKHIIQIILQMK